MQRIVIGLVVCVVFLLGLGYVGAETPNPATVLAKVNTAEILQSDVDLIFNTFVVPQIQARNQGKALSDEEKKQIEQKILNQLVAQKLILQAAAEAQITVDENLVTQQVEAVKAQRQDIPPDTLKELVQTDLTIQKVLEQEVASKVTISDEEVQKIYDENKDQFNEPEQVQASHILVQVKAEATQEEKDAARKKIETALAEAKAGKDFAELAKQYSDDPGSKEKGGDLGLFGRGMMIKPFEDTAFALEEGQISDVVETQFGYHIIKLTGKKAPRQVPFEEAKDGLKNQALQQKKNAEINNWIKGLHDRAKVEIMGQPTPEEKKPEEPK